MDLQDSVQRSLQNPAEKSCKYAQIRKDRKPGKFQKKTNLLEKPVLLIIDIPMM